MDLENLEDDCERFLQNLSYYCGDNIDVFDTSCLESVVSNLDGCVKDLDRKITLMKDEINAQQKHSDKPCETNILALNCFLNNVVQAAERNPGMEEFILQDFFRFVNDNHIILPALLSENAANDASSVSLNYIQDDESQSTQLLWERIRRTIKAGITHKLRDLPLSNCESLGERTKVMLLSKRKQLVNCLMLLYTYADVLQMYSSIRNDNVKRLEQLTKERRASVTWADEADLKNATIIDNFTQFLSRLTEMMQEDFQIFSSGDFRSHISISVAYSFVRDVYTQRIFENVDGLLSLVIEAKQKGPGLVQMSATGSNPTHKHNDGNTSSTEFNVAGDLDEIEISQLTKVIAACMAWQRALQQEIKIFARTIKSLPDSSQIEPLITTNKATKENNSLLTDLVRDESADNSIVTNESLMAEETCSWHDHIQLTVASLSKGLLAFIFTRSLQFINDDLQLIASGTAHAPVNIVEQLRFINGNEYPPKITLCGARLLSMLDEFFVLAHGCGLGVFDELRNALVEVIPCCFQEFHSHLIQTVRRFPQSGSIQSIYYIANTCSYASSQLNDYGEQIGRDKMKSLATFVPLFQSLQRDCIMIITSHHLKIIKNSILKDVESTNWESSKEFFEGERCSFSIEMWNFYMRSLVHDFGREFSSTVSRCLLLNLFRESLKLFVGRYAKAKPSYKRIDQYRADICAILHVSHWLLWYISDTKSDVLDPEPTSLIAHCQTMCTTLLSYMLFVTCPLDMLSDCVIKLSSQESQSKPLHITDWLSMVSLAIPVADKRESINPSASLIISLKLLTCRQSPVRNLLFQLLCSFNAALPIAISQIEESKLYDVISSSEPPLVDVNLSWHFSCDQNVLADFDRGRFNMAVCNLLFTCSDINESLSDYLVHLFESSTDSWSMVANWTRQRTSEGEFPIWLKFLSKKVNNILYRVLHSSVERLCEKDRIRSIPSCVFSTLTTLPCGCAVNQPTQNAAVTIGTPEVIFVSIEVVLSQLISSFAFFPRAIKTFFHLLDARNLGSRSLHNNKKSIGLQILAILINNWMSCVSNIRSISPFELSQQTTASIEAFSELLWHALHSQELNVASNPDIPTELCSFIKKNNQSLTDKLMSLQNACAMSVSSSSSKTEGERKDESDSLYDVVGKSLRTSDEGYTAMVYLFKFLSVNTVTIEDHLLRPLALNPVLLQRRRQPKSNGSSSFCSRLANDIFDPVSESQQLGDYSFDQSVLTTAKPDWRSLFEMFPVARKRSLQSLVFNRFEFQDGALKDLTGNEIVSVAKIFKHFGISLQ